MNELPNYFLRSHWTGQQAKDIKHQTLKLIPPKINIYDKVPFECF